MTTGDTDGRLCTITVHRTDQFLEELFELIVTIKYSKRFKGELVGLFFHD